MRGLLYIPTDRPCLPAIASGAEECVAIELYDEPPALLVVEHVDGEHLAEHAGHLAGLARERGLRTLHVTPSKWRSWLNRLLAEVGDDIEERERFSMLLDPQGVAYGAGPNKAALIAAALGVDVLHRRDSDLVVIEGPDGPALPAVLESRAIGRRAASVHPLANADALTDLARDQTVYFVGSAYWGDPPHDRRSLLKLDPELVVRIEQLSSPGSSLEELRGEVDDYFTTEPTIRYDEDFYEVDMTGRTELGISCIAGVFRHLPEMPANEILGCDYFQKNLLYQLNQPVLFHSRKMEHRHVVGGARGHGTEAMVRYGLRDLRYLMLWRVWSRHNRSLRDAPEQFAADGVQIDADAYAASLEAALASERADLAEIAPSFAAIYEDAASIATDGDAAQFTQLASVTRESCGQLLDQVAIAVQDFGWLVRRWRRVIAAADALGPESLRDLRPGG